MRQLKNQNIQKKVFLLMYTAVAIILFYSCYYADFYETGLEGVRFWDILFEGKILQFYTQIFRIGNTQYIPLYDFPMYIIFAIWNFPLWIVEKLSGIDIYHSVPCLMWMKSMLLFWLIMFLSAFGQLLQEVFSDRNAKEQHELIQKGKILFMTSTFVMTGLVILGQYDVITMTFMMMGLRAYLKKDVRGFVLWFALAAPLKYFSLLIYAPLVLVEEKKIHRIFLRAIEVVIPMVFFWAIVPYGRPELVDGCVFSGSSEGTNMAKPIYDALFVQGSVAFGTLFWYIFAEVLFLILCYCYQRKVDENRVSETIYICLMAYVIQFTVAYSHPYWVILMTPFMVVVVLMDEKKRYLNLLLEIVIGGALALAQVFYFEWCFCSNIVDLSFWQYLLPGGVSESSDGWNSVIKVVSGFVSDDRLQDYAVGVGLSIYLAAVLVFMIWNCPFLHHKLQYVSRNEREYRWLYPLRAIVSVVIGTIPVAIYVMKAVGVI